MSDQRNEWLRDPGFAGSTLAKALREAPLGFVDVGARGGIHPLVHPICAAISVLAFDPDPEAVSELSAAEIEGWGDMVVMPYGLADGKGERTLHLLSAPTNHSLRPPHAPFTERYRMVKHLPVDQITVPTITLDEVLFDLHPDRRHWGEFLKLDTQGTEHEILTGALRTLTERTVCVLAEVEFCQIYAGQKLFSDIEVLMRQHGFSFYGFTKYFYRSRKLLDKRRAFGRERIMCADAVFFKDPLPGGWDPALDDRRRKMLTVCALMLGYYDFVLELIREGGVCDRSSAPALEAFVTRLAEQPPEGTVARLRGLADAAAADPGNANVLAGRFADDYRTVCDFDDVVP